MTRIHTRRSFLQGVGSMGVIGSTFPQEDGSSTSSGDTSCSASDFVIPASEVPEGFDPYRSPDSNSLIDALDESTIGVSRGDVAVRGYWKGNTRSDPEWVLSATAIVDNEPLPRASIENAANQACNEYASAYDAETSPLIDIKKSHTCRGQTSDWRIDIFQTSLFENSNDGTEHILTDRMRFQFFGNVALGTIAFGPTTADPSIDSLLAEYAALQRTQYKTHGDTP